MPAMLNENSTLASIAYVLGRTLAEDYGIDPAPIFAASDIDCWSSFQPGERVSVDAMDEVWERAERETGDPLVGLTAGFNIQPGHYYAFGHSWLASKSLLGAMRRLCRYHLIISTAASKIEVKKHGDDYLVVETYPKPSSMVSREAGDFGLGSVLKLCEFGAGRKIKPLAIELICDDASLRSLYEAKLETRVTFSSDCFSATFSKADMETPFSAAIPEVAKATDRIADHYLEMLDTSKVAARVRYLLVDLLPSGRASQNRVAESLHRSASTLQRQLHSEGTSYREVLEDARTHLAKDYLRDGKFSHAHIAYLLGFSDQSNFSRAFKRWTGSGPREFQEAQKGAQQATAAPR